MMAGRSSSSTAIGAGSTARTHLPTQPLRVFVDEGCGLCRRVAKVMARLGTRGRIEFMFARDLDLFTADARLRKERYEKMVGLAGGQGYQGYDTYVQIVARSLALRPLLPIFKARWVRLVGERVYTHVANSRTCALPRASA